MEVAQPDNKSERPQVYELEWILRKYQHPFVDYTKLNSVNSSEGQLLYRGVYNYKGFTMYRHSSDPRRTFSWNISSSHNKVLRNKTTSEAIDFTFFGRAMNKQLSLPLFSGRFTAPQFHFTYYGHHIRVLPSIHSGYLNRKVSVEARLMFPHALQSSDSEAKEDMDYTVLWTHRFVSGSPMNCTNSWVSFFSVNEQLIQNLPFTPPLLPRSTASTIDPSHPHPFITIMDVEYPELLLCFFSLVYFYYKRYEKRALLVFLFVFIPLFLMVMLFIILTKAA